MKLTSFLILFLLTSFAFAEELEGAWEIEVSPIKGEEFPWWNQIKYPAKLAIKKTGKDFEVTFTDQYSQTCTGSALSNNNGKEIVFEHCGGLGTKSELSWGPIHHAKVVNGKLQGVVTTNKHLFNWVGERAK